MAKPVIGVLALQGCVQPHRSHIESLGAVFKEVRSKEDFQVLDALILPGGESTTMLKLIDSFSLWGEIAHALDTIPVWGICAGLILMAKTVLSPEQRSFGVLDVVVERNSYGRQLESFHSDVDGYEVAFIRAPKILSVGTGTQILSRSSEDPTWVLSGRRMGTSFHPELNSGAPSPMHRRFAELVRA